MHYLALPTSPAKSYTTHALQTHYLGLFSVACICLAPSHLRAFAHTVHTLCQEKHFPTLYCLIHSSILRSILTLQISFLCQNYYFTLPRNHVSLLHSL